MSAGALNTDFDLMSAVAAGIDGRNEEIRTMLGSFIGQMSAVPPSVWGGAAAARFREVVDRWNAESLTLHASLSRIAETLRDNERTLRTAARMHAEGLGAVAADVDAVPR